MAYYLAIDIGASSGRHILGWVENGHIMTEELYRFENKTQKKNGQLVWDVEGLFGQILAGLRRCAEIGRIPKTVGVDTWAVDFVLLDKAGNRIGDAVAYRDARTDGMDLAVEKHISFGELYQKTGIQKLPFNTIYQLMALKTQAPDQLERAQTLLMLPDYFHFLLTGRKTQEYTNATSTALLNAEAKTWDRELINRLGYPERLFSELATPGTAVGPFQQEIAKQVGFSARVVLPATHDTGSAYLAVPARDENSVYLSSGTWSLIGVESPSPIITPAGMAANFTNEGGYGYRFRFLKNIMGLWMLQSIKAQSERELTFAEIEELARANSGYRHIVDVSSNAFLAPENMRRAIEDECRKAGDPAPKNLGEAIQCVYESLAHSYKLAVDDLETITGRQFDSLNIVGGGCQDRYLNQLTANRTNRPVYAGPAECTALGNLISQMLAAGEFDGLQEARDAVAKSFTIETFKPE